MVLKPVLFNLFKFRRLNFRTKVVESKCLNCSLPLGANNLLSPRTESLKLFFPW